MSIFSWETDKLKFFFENLKISNIFSGHLKGFVKKSIFDNFRAPWNWGVHMAPQFKVKKVPFLEKMPLNQGL